MAITLGGVALPDGSGDTGRIDWRDRYAHAPVAQAVRQTLGGSPVVYAAAQSLRPITLVAERRSCWLMPAVKDQLEALAAVPGAVYLLDFEGEQHNVVFAHHDGVALDLTPLTPLEDFFVGTINLLAVD